MRKLVSSKLNQIILGGLLGDFSCRTETNKTACIRTAHCLRQEEYLLWKASFFHCKVRLRKTLKWNRVEFASAYREEFAKYLKFYKNRKKVINKNLLNQLNLLGLLVWYCDDGCFNYRTNTCLLCTEGFNLKEIRMVQEFFLNKFKINSSIHKAKIKRGFGFRINFGSKGTKKFLKIIEPFAKILPSSMHYKFGGIFLENKQRLLNSFKEEIKRNRQYYQSERGKEINKQKCKRYYLKHWDEIQIKERKRYWQNREKYLRRNKESYLRNIEKRKIYKRKYCIEHLEEIKIYGREYRKKNKEKLKERARLYYLKNRRMK